jgi:hypothetical protein
MGVMIVGTSIFLVETISLIDWTEKPDQDL